MAPIEAAKLERAPVPLVRAWRDAGRIDYDAAEMIAAVLTLRERGVSLTEDA